MVDFCLERLLNLLIYSFSFQCLSTKLQRLHYSRCGMRTLTSHLGYTGESGWIWRLGKRIMRRLGTCHPRTHLRVSVTYCLEKRAQRGTVTAVTACEKLTRRGWVVWSFDFSRGKNELLGGVEGRQILFQFRRENFLTTRSFQQGMALLLHKIASAREEKQSLESFYCLRQIMEEYRRSVD